MTMVMFLVIVVMITVAVYIRVVFQFSADELLYCFFRRSLYTAVAGNTHTLQIL